MKASSYNNVKKKERFGHRPGDTVLGDDRDISYEIRKGFQGTQKPLKEPGAIVHRTNTLLNFSFLVRVVIVLQFPAFNKYRDRNSCHLKRVCWVRSYLDGLWFDENGILDNS